MSSDVHERTLHHLVEELARTEPEREVVRFLGSDVVLTAADLDARMRMAGAGLSRLGVSAGDRVLIVIDNRPEFLVAWLACAVIGAISVPLNTALRGAILDHMVQLTTPTLAIIESAHLDQVGPSLPSDVRRVLVDGPVVDSSLAWEDLFREDDYAESCEAKASDSLSIMFTSGTTGPSKGVVFTHGTAIGLAESAIEVMGHGPGDIAYTCLPLFHSNALYTTVVAAMLRGGRSLVAPRFSASDFWSQIAAHGATLANLLGSMAPILARQEPSPEERSHRLRLALVIPTPPEGAEAFEERFGTPTTELYGLTDVGIPLGVPLGEERPAGSCGRALREWECDVVDDDDHPLPHGEVGQLVVRPRRSNIAAAGYWDMAEATVESWRNLWMHTGDLVSRDADGWFRFVDRGKDAIRRFGENISSFEVEQVILAHDDVEDVAVYAVPADLAEDEVMAAVVPRAGAPLSAQSILDHCEARLPYFAVPRYVELIDELPRTATAKIRKQALRARGVTPATHDAGPRGRRAREHARRGSPAGNLREVDH